MRSSFILVLIAVCCGPIVAKAQSVIDPPKASDAKKAESALTAMEAENRKLQAQLAELSARLADEKAIGLQEKKKLLEELDRMKPQSVLDAPQSDALKELIASLTEQVQELKKAKTVAAVRDAASSGGKSRGPASVLEEPTSAQLQATGEHSDETEPATLKPKAAISRAAQLMKEADEAMEGLDVAASLEEMTEALRLKRQIHIEGMKRILEQISSPSVARPEPDPLAPLKQSVREAELRREIEKYHEVRTELFYTNWIGRFIFVIAHVVLAVGLWMAVREFKEARLGRRRAIDQTQEVKLSLEGLAFKTAMQGTVILAFAMGFYFLYIKFVYPVTTVGGGGS